MSKRTDEPETYIHGYDVQEFPDIKERYDLAEEVEPDNWQEEFEKQRELFQLALRLRNPYSILARSASQCIVENSGSKTGIPRVQFPTIELLQASLLMIDPPSPKVAPSPGTLARLWKNGDHLLRAFIKKQPGPTDQDEDVFRELAYRSKVQTLHYRFNFDRDACLLVIKKITSIFDSKTQNSHNVAARYASLVQLLDQCGNRLGEHYSYVDGIQKAKTKSQVTTNVNFFTRKSLLAERLWSKIDTVEISLEAYRYLAFQIAEIAQEWIYVFNKADLQDLDNGTLSKLSMKPGDLAEHNFEHLFMDNPVWSKPFIERADGSYFTATPQAAFSFPFRIIDSLIPNDKASLSIFSDARSEALEDLVFDTVCEAMPSAEVYRSIVWKDPKSAVTYENDVIAILGNQIFVFEAKSGKIAEAAKRGGKKSLESSLDTLFVEPARQSERLQSYLNSNPVDIHLAEKGTREEVRIDLAKPKAVYRFSITMEGLASLTAGRRYFEQIGLINTSTPWAPSLSIGELRMLSKYLDSEVSFGHYLSRRYSLEELIDFIGDEQDLLSMYLTNGFCILGEDTKAKPIMFLESDEMVRTGKVPKADRANVDVIGVHLPGRWKHVAKEVYAGHSSIDRHKFDILFTLMNQPPPALLHLQKRLSKWKSGGGGKMKTGEHSKYVIGGRQFILILNFLNGSEFHDPTSVTSLCRALAMQASEGYPGTSDCLVLSFAKRSKTQTFDGISFFRLLPSKSPVLRPII